jgi:hypothetical protein
MGKPGLKIGFVIGDLDTERAYMLSQRSWISSPEKDPHPNPRYANHITQKGKPVIRRMSQGLTCGSHVHIPPAFTTYDVQINSMPC